LYHYSNACVGELLARLRKLSVADDGRLRLATVHSFCLTELVLPYARLAGLPVPDPLVVASPAQSRKVFEQAHLEILVALRRNGSYGVRQAPTHDRRPGEQGMEKWTAVKRLWSKPTRPFARQRLDRLRRLILTGLRLIEEHDWVRDASRRNIRSS